TGKATVDAKDPENDKLTYIWDFGNGTKKETSTPEVDFNYSTVGDYKLSATVKDSHGDSTASDAVELYAGNDMPQINIQISNVNKSFYLPDKPIGYSVTVTDNDTAKIDPANLFVSLDYVSGIDKASVAIGHQQASAPVSGKSL